MLQHNKPELEVNGQGPDVQGASNQETVVPGVPRTVSFASKEISTQSSAIKTAFSVQKILLNKPFLLATG